MNATKHTTITEHYIDIDGDGRVIDTRDGAAEVTLIRVDVYDDDDWMVQLKGYRVRKDGQRAANASFGLVIPWNHEDKKPFEELARQVING